MVSALSKLGLGIMFIGLATAVPQIDTMLFNVAAFPNVAHNFIQAGFLVIGCGLLYQATNPR